ncbi:MAG: hypothetical protein K1X55_11265 [Chitinophagales bacterium]|nr:hypothetical protein [Chitinophagales bacterium]
MRLIDIANEKGRNAEVLFNNPAPKRKILYVTANKEKPQTLRLVKNTSAINVLQEKYGDELTEKLINEDVDLDIEITGKFVGKATKILLDHNGKLVYKVKIEEEVYDAQGNLKEKRTPKSLEGNIVGEFPLRGGKLFPKMDIYNKFIFARKYQLRHVNGLTYDFLYDIAKDLFEKNAMMMLGGGPKGNAPLVFQDGGKPYRAFLEGRIKEESYCLILHITNLELKPLPKHDTNS